MNTKGRVVFHWTRYVLPTLCGALVLLISLPALAQSKRPSQEFSDAANAGRDAYQLGEYKRAKAYLNKAKAMEPQWPGPWRFLALVAAAEEDWEGCLKESEGAVRLAPKSRNAPALRKLHSECREKLDRPAFRGEFGQGGAIAITAKDEKGERIVGAVVKLNGLRYGATPMDPRAFTIGKVDIDISLKGYISQKAESEIFAGLVTDAIFILKLDPNAKIDTSGIGGTQKTVKNGWVTVKVSPADAQVSFDGVPPELDEQGRIKTSPGYHVMIIEGAGHEPWKRRVRVNRGQNKVLTVALQPTSDRTSLRRKGYYALGAAALFGIVGAYYGLEESKAYDEASDIYDTETTRPATYDVDSEFVPIKTREEMGEIADRGKTYGLISNISLGLAAVAVGAGVYFFLKERPAERKGYPLPVAINPILPDHSSNTVGATLTFTKELDW